MNRHTPRFDPPFGRHHKRSHPSLFPLRMVLFVAEMESPARPPCASRDPDELLAMKLIEKIKHPEPMPLHDLRIESPQPLFPESILELADAHA